MIDIREQIEAAKARFNSEHNGEVISTPGTIKDAMLIDTMEKMLAVVKAAKGVMASHGANGWDLQNLSNKLAALEPVLEGREPE